MFGGEDEDDFTPATNSNLASLFSRPVEQGGNASLTYTAPKQPKKNKSESASQSSGQSAQLNVIFVKVVHTYKLEDGNYNPQGKLGAAILGNAASRLYQLLLYKNRQQHITTTKITDKFQFTVQAKNFASFYDDKGQNWSLMFESDQEAIVFAKEIGLARACSQGEQGENPFYVQDLKIGGGPVAELGDFLEIRYTATPLVDGVLSKAIESNLNADKPQRVKIRRGVWEEALIGATKGCKKLIILAPVLFGPWKPLVDPGNRLVVELEIGRVKASKKSVLTGVPQLADSSESNVDSGTDETSIKARGASISEALTNSPKTNKASIISRMARMGQATLPLKGAVVANPSDSEETEEESSGTVASAMIPSKAAAKSRVSMFKNRVPAAASAAAETASAATTEVSPQGPAAAISHGPAVASQHVSMFHPGGLGWSHPQQTQYMINGVPVAIPTHTENQLFAATTPHQVVPVAISTPTSTPSSDSHLAVYLSENRTHNSEVRMGLSKVIDKVDQALVKLDGLQQHRSGNVLDPHSLLASIQTLVADNDQLRAELADKRVKLDQQNEKIYQLLQQKFHEQSSGPSVQDISLQTMVLALQQEKTKLAADLNDALGKISVFQFQASNMEKVRDDINNVTVRLQTQQVELERSKQTILDQENLIRSLRERNEASAYLHQTQESAIANLKVNGKDLEAANAQLEIALREAKQQLDVALKMASEKIAALESAHKEENMKLKTHLESLASGNTSDNSSIKDDLIKNLQNDKEEISKKMASLEEENMKLKTHVDNRASGDTSDNSSVKDDLIKNLQNDKEEYSKRISSLEAQLKAAQETSTDKSSPTMDEIKKIMNVMFRLLKSEFVADSNYEGAAIRDTILSTIQDVTLQYVKMKAKSRAEDTSEERKRSANEASAKEDSGEVQPAQEERASDASGSPPLKSGPSDSSQSAESGLGSSVVSQDTKVDEKPDAVRQHPDLKVTHFEVSEVKDSQLEADPLKPAPPEPPSAPPSEEGDEEQCSGESEPGNAVNESVPQKSEQLMVKPRDPSIERGWRPQPPPSPLFDDEEDDDDWLS